MHGKGSLPFIPPLSRAFLGVLERERVAVLGLGNILLSDEGVGVHAAAALARSYTFTPSLDILDGGTLGLDLLPFFQTRDRILIIDAINLGKPPGYLAKFNGSEIRAVFTGRLSVHHIGFADLLSATLLTRETPPDLCLIGVQPLSLHMGLELTSHIRNLLDPILDLAVIKLQEWKIECFRTFF